MMEKKLRTVKSFVRRQGRMSETKKEALNSYAEKWVCEIGKAPLDFESCFSDKKKIVLEIGFGMGDSLIEMASREPDTGFIGVEVHTPGVANLLHEVAKRQLINIRIFHQDALLVLSGAIPDRSLDRVQLFFPDPWPKLRHHKRRIVQPSFVDLVQKKLKSKGVFHLATDWEDYAFHMLKVLSASQLKNAATNQTGFIERPAFRPMTKFEKRGLRLGHPTWDLMFYNL